MLREKFVVRNHHNPHTSGCCGTGGEGCCGGDNQRAFTSTFSQSWA